MFQISQINKLVCISTLILSTSVLSRTTKFNNNKDDFVLQQLELNASNYLRYKNKKPNKGTDSIVSMGNDPMCDVDVNIANIQQVIDSGVTEIRLADTATYSEDLFISNKSITIRGGYLNCEDANNDLQQSTKTLITGTSLASVISISGADETHTISLQNLDIQNGVGSDFFSGGGISTLGAKANITLENVNVSNNNGSYGGGIAINGGDTSLTVIDSIIQYNSAAVSGGGIYCTGNQASLALFGLTGVLNNTSLEQNSFNDGGGGLYLSQGCTASLFAGSSTNMDQFGISGNVSETNGGGVFLNDGAKLYIYGQEFCFFNVCFGDATQPVNISNNQAHDHHVYDFYGNGGGIYAAGSGTSVSIQGGLINNNHADFRGAGLYLAAAELNISKDNSSCWNKIRCNFFQANQVRNFEMEDTYGGALYIESGEANINFSYFEDNRADIGTAMHLNYGVTNISTSVLNNNGNLGIGAFADQSVISMNTQAKLTLEHVTIADNKVQTAIIAHNSSAIDLNIYSSIIYNPNSGPILDELVYVNSNINCVIAHEINTMQSLGGTHLLNNNPQFKDSLQRDYHLNAALSPALDFCPPSTVLGELKDIDGQTKGWDDGSISNDQNNINNTYDAGADESYDNDIIFMSDYD
jgi:hypothetical protein